MEDTDQARLHGNGMNIAVIGNYVPRQCGIATFTSDVAEWVARTLGPGSDVFVVAMNDRQEGYDYPQMVRFEVLAINPRDYPRAADYINLSGVDLVFLQHEFGIFGGPRGSYVTDLLRDLKKPVVTTAHTVLPDPEPDRRKAMVEVAALSDSIVVMSRKSIEFLEQYYGVPPAKIHLIHHGVPDMPFAGSDQYKGRWGLEGRTVLLTFGLLHSRKGIEYMIEAMPEIVARFPDTVYVVLGATHPPLKRKEGEKYRFFLKRRARELGVEDNVVFYDRFVTLEELTAFLASCDIYVTPYLDPNQIVSGTLAYAIGLGKPVISTPYYYAEELLGEGRGVLVPARDPQAIARAATDLLGDPAGMAEMRERAYAFGRKMIWKEVSAEYVRLFERVLAGRRLAPVAPARRHPVLLRDLPRPKLDYLVRLTDDTGVIHKSHFDIADRASGYTTEDNALALSAAVLGHLQTDDPQSLELARVYIGFLRYMQKPDGRFHDALNYDKTYADDEGSEECQGKALEGLGVTVALESDEGLASFAKALFDDALEGLELTSLRAMAYTVCGCYHYLTRLPGASMVVAALEREARKLLEAYRRQSSPGWEWFEDTLFYANGMMPRALLLAYRETGSEPYRQAALESLDFLTRVSYREGMFDLVGDQGWYPRGGERAQLAQLPIEAASITSACVDAFLIERDDRYLEFARAAFEWFLGRNILDQPLYDFASFSCSDGLLLREADPNRSAEATVHWLLALLRIQTALHLEPSAAGGPAEGGAAGG
jgi:glycosyltransferase involved in cell wall biosynthesis